MFSISRLYKFKLKLKYTSKLPKILIGTGLLLIFLSIVPVIKTELLYYWWQLTGTQFKLSFVSKDTPSQNVSVFGNILRSIRSDQYSVFGSLLNSTSDLVALKPASYDFSIIIERIGVNAPVVANVSVANPKAYQDALKKGVAHAFVSDLPSNRPGNVYLFAHTSLNFWDLGKYATTFNLLHKLEPGDTVYIVYKGTLFEYKVTGKDIVKGWDTRPLTRRVIEPILTLQTCSPPGTTLNRLVVTARLVRTSKL